MVVNVAYNGFYTLFTPGSPVVVVVVGGGGGGGGGGAGAVVVGGSGGVICRWSLNWRWLWWQ